MAIGCSLLITLGMHSLAGWLFGNISPSNGPGSDRAWRWTWTLALYLGIWLLFFAVMGAVGVAHQVGWLLRSKEPVMVRRKFNAVSIYQLRPRGIDLLETAIDAKWRLEDTRRAFFLKDRDGRENRAETMEDFHIILFPGTNGQMVAGIIFHRDSLLRARSGFVLVTPLAESELRPISELPAILARYQSPAAAEPNGVRFY